MSEHDIVVGKLDEILTILSSNTTSNTSSNTTSNTISNTSSNSIISSNSYINIVSEIKSSLTGAVGNGISSFVVNQYNVNGQQKTVIEIKE